MMKIATVALAATLLLAGCNTISGIGKDTASVGKAVSHAADGAK
ncbi:MAG TPA: entericidin A/B family lipoprotein [Sphingomonadaceae bacterium]|nr:entericidin A/B family lipoprotein [Sphingomonadaceae bacterium]